MKPAEAAALIRSAVTVIDGATWADFGAGTGTFTEALADLLGANGKVIAIDRDASALRHLRGVAKRRTGAEIVVAAGDVLRLETIPSLEGECLDGALFANVLHYIEQPALVLKSVRGYLGANGRVMVVEYDRRSASRWVPHPLPLHELTLAARRAGLSKPFEIGRQKSRYQGELYCAVMTLAE